MSRRIACSVGVAMLGSPLLTHALAQYGGQLSERESKPILEYFLAIAFTGLCIAIAVMNPKRSHQA